MSPQLIIFIVLGYFLLLILVSLLTSRDDSNNAFFIGKKQSPWYVVAFGMIGASLSGVTFISVPGWVADGQFAYMQMVLGYLVGYAVVALVLLPLYYRLNLISIYGYLEQRFGTYSYKTGAFFFLLSRVIGASFRMFLVAISFHVAVFQDMGLPFWVAVLIAITLIWVYTFRSGIKTIIWTDTLQTAAMLLSVVVTITVIMNSMEWSVSEAIGSIQSSGYGRIFFFDDLNSDRFFVKQFLAGMFITIAMTGLDQDMMQKNLSCRSLRDAQKNMFWFSGTLVVANLLFLGMGAMLYLYRDHLGLDAAISGDELFPMLALNGSLGPLAGVLFIVGLVAAAYSSADSALTSLTTSFCVDFLGMKGDAQNGDKRKRTWVHIGFSALIFVVIVVFSELKDKSVIEALFKVAGYTYGPLLGMFAFGLFTKRSVTDRVVPVVCVVAPVLAFLLQYFSPIWFNGYKIGFELLLINGLITFAMLWVTGIGSGRPMQPELLDDPA